MKTPSKRPWPTKDAMIQVYKNKLWGSDNTDFYSGEGSHDPETVQGYIAAIATFFKILKNRPVVCDLGCGDFNVGKELVQYTEAYKAVDIVPELISYNTRTFQRQNLTFDTLDIAKDELPTGDCVLLRQVLQHLSNNEIKDIVEKLYAFKYVILTEHLPDEDYEPNKDIISGQGIRLKKQSGVDLLLAPFNLRVKEAKQLLVTPAPGGKGHLVTTVFTML
ncbi:class I SAM-dependent methyltransferase [Flavimarina sp. Hel_I_48]|uniref:class I SAM-dependent methyltransferase n=1 Tax=Flavimarina sp. Hel_I_48 TaxID=1392488 RepID=UPI0004DF24F9|nr:class I SAM-dependent methyltransferase [Flavimarina sp. Hel_I_48]